MDPTWLVLSSLALGLAVGAGFVALLHVAAGRGVHAAAVADQTVPDGIDHVLDALDAAGMVIDPSGNVVKASPGALGLGLVANRRLMHDELASLVGELRGSGDPIAADIELPRGRFGDATTLLHVRVAPLGSRYVLVIAEDRTEARRLDEVRRDFVANISHELKTPIGAISVLAEALGAAADDPARVRAFADRLSAESGRLARITQDIIDLSRLQSADALTHPDEVVVDDVVAAAVDQNRVTAAARGIDLAVGRLVGATVYGDETLLVTAVHNLISNAIRYSPEHSRVGIGVKADDATIEIAVTDQGEGIPADDLDRVFERFYRVDAARSRDTGGSGLGLAIVKHAVQNHGGEVRVWSKPGRGSTFTVRLPRAEAAPQPDLPIHDAVAAPVAG